MCVLFLAELHQEEKEAFLELANLMAAIDGNRSIFEETIINKFKKEMDLEDYQLKGLMMEDILKIFKTERTKNIVLAEIFQLIYADGVFHRQESESVSQIKAHFGFDSSEFGSFKDWVGKIKELSNS
jgi:DnaJ-domain-containing protein 1